jgi:hypothetical protein
MGYQAGQRPTEAASIVAFNYKKEDEQSLHDRGVQRVEEVGLGESLLDRETVLHKDILFGNTVVGANLSSKSQYFLSS